MILSSMDLLPIINKAQKYIDKTPYIYKYFLFD